MGYNPGAFGLLKHWLRTCIPHGGSLLELGCQHINDDVPGTSIAEALSIIHGKDFEPAQALEIARADNGRMYVHKLFAGSQYDFWYLDLYAHSEHAIVADLNYYAVPQEFLNRFHMITNFGTTEHIPNQLNAMKAIHDFTAPEGRMFHSVPWAGYYNHGLINYHPIFFLFLANANGYAIEHLTLNTAHLPYTIPVSDVIHGAEFWSGKIIDSGILNCQLQRKGSEAFCPFTDFDRLEKDEVVIPELREVLGWRYDLRIREE